MDQSQNENPRSDRLAEAFVALMSASQMYIYTYIIAIIGNSNDADDIMQDTSITMWNRYSEFKVGTDFTAWGRAIAYYKIKEFRKQQSRIQFSDETFNIIHKTTETKLSNVSLFVEKLHSCMAKLAPSDSNLIKLRYESGASVKRISMCFNTTVQAVYVRLSKIHGVLSRCIKHSIREESF